MDALSLIFILVSNQLNLPNNLLRAVCFVESSHNAKAIHLNDGKGDSLGLCQIKLATAKMAGFKGTQTQLMDPLVNAYYAGLYLKKQINKYGGVRAGVIAYNRGHYKKETPDHYYKKVIKAFKEKR